MSALGAGEPDAAQTELKAAVVVAAGPAVQVAGLWSALMAAGASEVSESDIPHQMELVSLDLEVALDQTPGHEEPVGRGEPLQASGPGNLV